MPNSKVLPIRGDLYQGQGNQTESREKIVDAGRIARLQVQACTNAPLRQERAFGAFDAYGCVGALT
jgi:hypothetical protein